MGRPRLLDLFCCAGGAGMGYHRAGFDVTGVDIQPQPRYPFTFVQADALAYLAAHGHEFDAIHASPPCQAHTSLKRLYGDDSGYRKRHPDLVAATRAALNATGLPWVMENVKGAPLYNAVELCGAQFGLKVYRHRLFESNILLTQIPHTPHHDKTPSAGRGPSPKGFISVSGTGGAQNLPDGMTFMEYAGPAMGIDWMGRTELSQAIPPAYTEFIGRQLIACLTAA